MNAVLFSTHCGLIFKFNGMYVTATKNSDSTERAKVFFVTHEPLQRNVNSIYSITCIWPVDL